MDQEHLIKKLAAYYNDKSEVLFGYLFGSFAQGTNRQSSDLDIGIYLENVATEDLLAYRLPEIENLQKMFERTADLVIINQAPPLLKHEIFRHGILFKSHDDAFLVQYRVASFYQYLDQSQIIKRYFEINKAKIQGDGYQHGKQFNHSEKGQRNST